jgi:TPP-dependent pyruvate/acetoin dehydrogenase alpha subunit
MMPVKSDCQEILRQMLRIRIFEENLYRMYLEKRIPGMSPHLSVGQEAVAVGVCRGLASQDYLLTTHRGHGHVLARGASMKRTLAEILGKEEGYCHGRGGSLHVADVSLNIVGANGIVGGGLPIAVGVALSSAYLQKQALVVCFFGDGAANIGSFHESLNLASMLKLPVLWVCENNHYALSTRIENTLTAKSVFERAGAYNMPGWRADGNDVLAVYETTLQAVERIRQGGGPALIEADTYRWYGHGASDNRSYRTREEEDEWKKRCPIETFRKKLRDDGLISDQEFSELEEGVKTELKEALQFAENSPSPDPLRVLDNVFSEQPGVTAGSSDG